MKIKSVLFFFATIAIVALVSYYIGGSMRGTNSGHQSIHAPVIEAQHPVPSQKDAVKATNQEQIAVPDTLTITAKQIEAINADFERKKQEIQESYAVQFRRLQQNVETELKKYDVVDRTAYAEFTWQLKNAVSTTSGASNSEASAPGTSALGDVSLSGSPSAQGETANKQASAAPSAVYERYTQRIDKNKYNLMDDYELDFERLQRQRACALDDLEKEKTLALTAVHSQNTSQSLPPPPPAAKGTVTGIIYSEKTPLAVIDGSVLHEKQGIRNVTIVKINRDSVEFESAGSHWKQKVNEPPSTNWH